jgi:hypothetical protein
MLKTLKWVYDLGVKQERQRIARHLEGHVSRLGDEYDVGRNMLRDIPDSAKRRKQRLELKQAVTLRVIEIVNNILQPRYEDRASYSVMFPDEDKKNG